MFGSSLPSWLANESIQKFLLKRHVRSSKYEPFVDEVELLEANHQYAHIRYPDGRESTVSVQHLAPIGVAGDSSVPDTVARHSTGELSAQQIRPEVSENEAETKSEAVTPLDNQNTIHSDCDATPLLRRSQRQRRPPKLFGFE